MKKTAEAFKALSEEIRLRLLLLLHSQGELCVCELIPALDLPQSTISRHLAYLKNSGWVEGRRRGVWMHYRLAPGLTPLMREILDLLNRETGQQAPTRRDISNLERHRRGKHHPERCS